jgi:hypothetical protein
MTTIQRFLPGLAPRRRSKSVRDRTMPSQMLLSIFQPNARPLPGFGGRRAETTTLHSTNSFEIYEDDIRCIRAHSVKDYRARTHACNAAVAPEPKLNDPGLITMVQST